MQIDLFDSHIHSKHSPDAQNDSALDLCNAAVRMGLTGIAVTDHCDLGPERPTDWRRRLDSSVLDIQRAREQFTGRLSVSVGIELGQPLAELPLALEALRATRYDVVLCSLHSLSTREDFYFMAGQEVDREALLSQYFDELLQMTEWGSFDVLTHLTYPLRYIGYGDGQLLYAQEERLRALFTLLAQRGKALEMNTSGIYRDGEGGCAMPGLWELRLFRECGGELVTLGSDAHCAADVGRAVEQGIGLLRAAGFSHQAFFRNRTPTLVRIF